MTPTGTLTLGTAPASAAGPGPPPGAARLGGCLRRHHLGDRAGASAPRRHRVRRVAVAVLRGRRRGDAHPGAERPAADRDPALRRDGERAQPRPPRPHRRRRRRRLPDDRRPRGRGRPSWRSGGPPWRPCSPTWGVPTRARGPAGTGSPGGSRRRTSATRCSTSASWSRPWRPRPSGPAPSGCTPTCGPPSRRALPGALVLCHISHVYETGCSLYFTVAAEGGDDPLARWRSAKAAATDAIVAAGATDHPPPRRRGRPPALAGGRDRHPRGARAARDQGGAGPDRRAQPRRAGALTPGPAIPVTPSPTTH